MLRKKLQFLLDEFMGLAMEEMKENLYKGEEVNLLEVEDILKELREYMCNNMLSRFIQLCNKKISEGNFYCEECGNKMKRHRKSEWSYGTIFGDMSISEDVYLYCNNCGISNRPLHSLLGTPRVKNSLMLEEVIVDFGIDESGRKAAEKIMRHYPNVKLDSSKVLRVLYKHGKQAREFIVNKLKKSLSSQQDNIDNTYTLELEVEYDGSMIPVAVLEEIEAESCDNVERTPIRNLPKRRKNCKWEEVKLGVVQQSTEDTERLYTVRHKDELIESFEDLLALAHMKNWSEDTNVIGIADGARYIKQRMKEIFSKCNFKFILDRPHAKEHLYSAAENIAKIKNINISAWVESSLFKMENGKVDEVIMELRHIAQIENIDEETKNILIKEANYFEYNQDSVAYAEYRTNGWSTASSEAESAHRHIIQARLKIPGAWWHPNNIPNILALRMLKANNWWDEYWDYQRKIWQDNAKKLKDKNFN